MKYPSFNILCKAKEPKVVNDGRVAAAHIFGSVACRPFGLKNGLG